MTTIGNFKLVFRVLLTFSCLRISYISIYMMLLVKLITRSLSPNTSLPPHLSLPTSWVLS